MQASSLRRTSAADKVARCRVTSLDRFLASREGRVPTFVKCDAEGAELGILRGARRLLRDQPAIWMLEFHPETAARFGHRPMEIVREFEAEAAVRYRAYRIMYPSGELVPLAPRHEADLFNAVFVPPALDQRLAQYRPGAS